MKRRGLGFTLLELMVTIAVLGILLGLTVPTFREFSRNNSVTTAQNDLVTALNVARSEALRPHLTGDLFVNGFYRRNHNRGVESTEHDCQVSSGRPRIVYGS